MPISLFYNHDQNFKDQKELDGNALIKLRKRSCRLQLWFWAVYGCAQTRLKPIPKIPRSKPNIPLFYIITNFIKNYKYKQDFLPIGLKISSFYSVEGDILTSHNITDYLINTGHTKGCNFDNIFYSDFYIFPINDPFLSFYMMIVKS